MNGQRSGLRIAAVIGFLLLSAAVGFIAYNAGVQHGIAQQLIVPGAQSGQASPQPYAYPYYPYGWYRPWGFGFGIFPLFFFGLIWFGLLRMLFWGGRWRHGYYGGWRGVPPTFDEWHRQAHERLKEQRPADNPDRRG